MNKQFHNFLVGVSVLPALLVVPAMGTGYVWSHSEDVDSYSTFNGDINFSAEDGNFITGTAMRNIVNGDVNLTLDGVTQTGLSEIEGVHGNAFLNSGKLTSLLGMPTLTDEQKTLRQYVDGNVNVVVKNGSSVDRNVVGNQFYTSVASEITGNIGLSGKTTITVEDSIVKGDVRGANIGDASTSTDTTLPVKVNDIEINIIDSLVEDEVVSTGAYVSAGNVKINVLGNSIIGYDATNTNNRALEQDRNGTPQADGWIVAGAQRNNSSVASTEVNLDTAGTIKIAGDVNAGSRQRSSDNTDAESVVGDATLNMLGGGNINIGGDVRAYHVGGATELNLNNITATVAGDVKEFQTINMDESAKLTAGTLTMTEDDTLNVVLASEDAYSQIVVDTLDAHLATLNMTVRNAGTYDIVSAGTWTSDFTWNLTNAVYDLTREEDTGTVVAKVKSSADIANGMGINQEAAAAVSGLAGSTSDALNDLAVKMQEKLAEAVDDESKAAVAKEVEKATKAIHPETESVTQSVASSVQNTVTNLASARMSAPTMGRNGGDLNLTSGGVWAQGLYNRTKQHDSFHGDTRGIAAGFDGTINRVWTVGAGYSYAYSDITGSERDTEIDSNTIFVYGQYKPAEWYVNAVLNYTMSDYSEKGTALGTPVTADYDVDSFGGVLTAGYDFASGITPELGLRYMHVSSDDYTNSLGVKTDSKDTDYLTGILGAKYAFNIAAGKYINLIPQLNAAVKYDMLSDGNSATVAMPGVNSYTIDGERLSRFGGEFGIGLGMKYRSLDLSVNYDIDVRKDYTSQTGMLKLRYNF